MGDGDAVRAVGGARWAVGGGRWAAGVAGNGLCGRGGRCGSGIGGGHGSGVRRSAWLRRRGRDAMPKDPAAGSAVAATATVAG